MFDKDMTKESLASFININRYSTKEFLCKTVPLLGVQEGDTGAVK